MSSQAWASVASFQNEAHAREASLGGSEVSRRRVRERKRKDTDTNWGGDRVRTCQEARYLTS